MVSEMDAWVEWYESNALVYFPLYGIINGACRCREGAACANMGKHPIYRWKDQPNRKPSEADNIGVSTNNLVVIDLDGDVGKDALASYPPTFTTTTGHGYHLWYKADSKKHVKSLVGWKRKVDIRAIGGLVVAPPSRHKSGSVYRATNDSPIMPIPQTLLYELPERAANYNRTGVPVTINLAETNSYMYPVVGLLLDEILNWKDSRNVTLFRVACRYFEMASKNILGADVLEELIQAAESTGLTSDEIQRTLASARRSV